MPTVINEWREIRLPEDLCSEAESKFGSRFERLDDLVAFLLRELVHGDTVELDKADRAAVEQRLKDLGYL